jgi:hypothetical protein
MALVKRAEIAQGQNPMAERLKARAAVVKDWVVRQLINGYREKVLVTLAKSTRVCYSRHLSRIENRLGSLVGREVESSDIVALPGAQGWTPCARRRAAAWARCRSTRQRFPSKPRRAGPGPASGRA